MRVRKERVLEDIDGPSMIDILDIGKHTGAAISVLIALAKSRSRPCDTCR